jgi:hypothetical protein
MPVPRTMLMRATGLTAVALALAVTLSGCAAIAGKVIERGAVASRTATLAKERPIKGECWQGTLTYDGYANWGTRPPVPCGKQHQLYTFAVLALEGIHTGKLFTKSGYAYEAIENDAIQTCDRAKQSDLPAYDDATSRVYIESYLPEENEWDAGARWVRCDIAVVKVGSSVKHPAFEYLPVFAALRATMKDAPSQFNFCVNDPGGLGPGGPKGSNAIYADCRNNPQWTLAGYKDIVTGTGGAYPTPAQMKAQYQLSCVSQYADSTHITYPYYPSKTDWDTNGDEQYECWVGRK